MNAEQHERYETEASGWRIGVTTWRLGARWMCRIDNVRPGATVARGQGGSRDQAIERAMHAAARRMGRTRRFALD